MIRIEPLRHAAIGIISLSVLAFVVDMSVSAQNNNAIHYRNNGGSSHGASSPGTDGNSETLINSTVKAANSVTSKIKGDIVMTESDSSETSPQHSKPNPDLKSLNKLVGSWKVSGDAQGQVKYEWMEGGFFLVQHFDIDHAGHKSKGIEVIGHLQPFGEEPGKEIRTRVYSYLDGLTLDYVYEVESDTLTIWGGEKGSPAYYKGKFSADGNTLTGEWVYPGGGYKTITTRIK